MRAGLFGAVGSGTVHVPGAQVQCPGPWTFALAEEGQPHPVQQSVLSATSVGAMGLHGVWLHPPRWGWGDGLEEKACQDVVSSPEAFRSIEGVMQGCAWNAQENTLLLHADFARQHPLFWVIHDSGLLFANSVDRLVRLMRENGLDVVPDEEAAALLLTFGCVVGDRTLVQGVRKLMPGHSLRWTPTSFSVEPRDHLGNIQRDLLTLPEAASALDAAFKDSIHAMVEANRQAGCVQHNLLSGGLDSRLVALATSGCAENVVTMCFSAKGYRDEHFSADIASAWGLTHRFHDLGQGEYMMETSSVMEYDGCVNFLASAHHRSALEALRPEQLGLLASGQGANVLLTDVHRWTSDGDDVLKGMVWYGGVKSRAWPSAKAAWEAFPNPQVFKVINRGFLYTNSGAYSTAHRGVLWSPFTSQAFVKTALRLDPRLVSGQQAYLAWMASHWPAATKFPWERYGVRPVLGWRLRLAQVWAKVEAQIGKRFPRWAPGSMSPIQVWHDQSPRIQDFYRQTYVSHREWLSLYPELKTTVERDYATMSVMNKASVLTLLLASKSWFRR